MSESLVLLVATILLVFVGAHDVFQFFMEEKESRVYWLKWWIVFSLIVGLIFWLILRYSGK